MAEDIIIDAQIRTETGKNENRRLRVAGMIPGILYGAGKENINLSVKPFDIKKILHSKTGANTLFHINMIGERTTRSAVMIKEFQLHPVRDELIHCDFLRIKMDEKIHVTVPIHINGKSIGVSEAGGVLEIIMRELSIECLPTDIPPSVDIDITSLEIGDEVRIKDFNLGEKISILHDEDLLIVHVVLPKKAVLTEAEAAAEGEEEEEEEEPKEPEVIKKGKAEEQEE